MKPCPSLMNSVQLGEALREARRRQRLKLEDVSQVLRISLRFLSAMERGDFAALPDTGSAVRFLGAYAAFLNLDEEGVVNAYREISAPVTQTPSPTPIRKKSVPPVAILALSLLLIVVVLGLWRVFVPVWGSLPPSPVPERLLP